MSVMLLVQGLYVHVPFCRRICSYCDFSKLVATQPLIDDYLDALKIEIEANLPLISMIETVYVGGGTPSSVGERSFERLLSVIDKLPARNNIREFTIEANPEDVDSAIVALMLAHGVTRVSLGAQTFDQEILDRMHREGGYQSVKKAFQLLKNAGFAINIDMIYGYPGQTLESVNRDLDLLIELGPGHVSYYSLILEDKTELGYLVRNNRVSILDDDLSANQSDIVTTRLELAGLKRYEISNYALDGQRARHNLLYWNLQEYLGVGLSASSQYNGSRYRNCDRISAYLRQVRAGGLPLRTKEPFEPEKEMIILGLRLVEGISLALFETRFGKPVLTLFPGLEKHLHNGLLELTPSHLRLTERGLDLANQVMLSVI